MAELLDLREGGKRGAAHFVPGRERRAVVLVHDGDASGMLGAETLEVQRDNLWRAGFLGEEEVPHGDGERAITAPSDKRGV